MRAVLADQGPRYDAEYPDPTASGQEALIRVRLAGVCNTDLELLRGYMDYRGVLGHEFVGEVVQAADDAWIGRRVVGDINAACYACETCLAGRHTHCTNRTTLGIYRRDGAFADYLLLPQANLYAVPDNLPDEMAVFVEPLAAACEILEQIHIHPMDRMVVLGDGKLGLLVAAVLRLTGAKLTLIGRHDAKLAIARAWGVATMPASDVQACEPADIVVECTGSPDGFAMARSLLRPRGTLVLKSTYHDPLTLDMSALVVDEINLIGSRCGPFAPALRLMEAGLVDPRALISARYTIEQGVEALAAAAAPGALKVLLST
jgi:alcohol dehydrogenase